MLRRARLHLDMDEVLDAAVAVAFEAGLGGVTPRAVAARCGAPVAAVTAVGGDAEGLVAATFERISRAEFAALKRQLLSAPSPVDQLRLLLETIAEPAGLELDRVWTEVWTLGHTNRKLRVAALELETAWHSLTVAIVRRGIRTGDFLDVDPDAVAGQLLIMSAGISAYALIDYQRELDRMRLLELIVRAELGVRFDLERVPLG